MEKPLETIPQVTLETQVLDRLRQAILEGHFPPGSQLNQVQIAAQFGISRGPVRVAINKLEKEGLVMNYAYRGTFVAPLEKKKVSDLYEVRAALEAFGVRLAVARCQTEDIAAFESIVDEMRAAAHRSDTSEVIRLDFKAHEFFMEMACNQVLLETWSTLKVQVQRVLGFRHRSYPNLVEIADSHLPFIKSMQTRDTNKAAKIMEAHILEARDDLMERWAGDEGEPC
jgi:DNA-binding GntR family transcriptional regulator